MTTKANQKLIARQPFEMSVLVDWCKTKNLAERLAITLGDALNEADKARNRGDCDDSAFELMFHDGTLFLSDDDLWEMGVNVNSLVDFTNHTAYEEELDATFHLCFHPEYDRGRFIVCRYEFKEDDYALSAWWLERSPVRQGC